MRLLRELRVGEMRDVREVRGRGVRLLAVRPHKAGVVGQVLREDREPGLSPGHL